jgi:hypothetical protein
MLDALFRPIEIGDTFITTSGYSRVVIFVRLSTGFYPICQYYVNSLDINPYIYHTSYTNTGNKIPTSTVSTGFKISIEDLPIEEEDKEKLKECINTIKKIS